MGSTTSPHPQPYPHPSFQLLNIRRHESKTCSSCRAILMLILIEESDWFIIIIISSSSSSSSSIFIIGATLGIYETAQYEPA
jgi:hypothetical protein